MRDSFPSETGMLVVDRVLQGGPASDVVQVGDVLVRVNGDLLTSFKHLEVVVDAACAAGSQVQLELSRGGQGLVTVDLPTINLHDGACVPTRFVEVGGCVFHGLSLGMAIREGFPHASTVVCSQTGFMSDAVNMTPQTIIASVNGVLIDSLQRLVDVLSPLPHGAHTVRRSCGLWICWALCSRADVCVCM